MGLELRGVVMVMGGFQRMRGVERVGVGPNSQFAALRDSCRYGGKRKFSAIANLVNCTLKSRHSYLQQVKLQIG